MKGYISFYEMLVLFLLLWMNETYPPHTIIKKGDVIQMFKKAAILSLAIASTVVMTQGAYAAENKVPANVNNQQQAVTTEAPLIQEANKDLEYRRCRGPVRGYS
ncbi:hypothetical protein [Paenibacillus thiaminolyticus]|uniref:Uncharacterized protein n=1 Tax=Paenibacillus thiaminolyticus TaxID=49283 RepID=A0A3A3GHK9_PANTH|nr:hypothetical protein [Paenibacillus thiaminolyticus]RJG22785.1 hypothetical protein DQX05_16265 [Paenibacillus thiaminolyticus]